MSTLVRTGIVVALVAGVAGGSYYAKRRILPTDRVLPGVRIDGAVLPDVIAKGSDQVIEAWIDGRLASRLDRPLVLHAGSQETTTSVRDITDPVDTAAIVARIRTLGREGTLGARIDTALRARRGEIDLPLSITANAAAIEALVAPMKPHLDEAAVDATLDLAAHTVHLDKPGHAFDVDGGVVTVEEWVRRCGLETTGECASTNLQMEVLEYQARVTAEALGNLDISTVVGSFETFFGRFGDQAPRAANIERAASKLDGLVLEPSRVVSFNEVVGERSEANGFKLAWEIFKGEMRPGVGGGTCQVASTLHAAAFFAGIDIVERLPHSRPSAYIPMGLDSTVVYPSVDLKLKNPYTFPLVVHTSVVGNKIRIELLGKEKPFEVEFARDTVQVMPYERRLDEDANVKPGKAVKKQGGIRGYRIRRTRVLKPLLAAFEQRSETTFDFYPPTTEIYLVAPGTEDSELPAMPDDVAEALAKKHGDLPPEYADAVACAGDCEGETKDKVEVSAGATYHAPTGDQAYASPKVLLKQ